MTRRLQVTLYVVAAYLAIFGILFLFAPGVFEQITQSKLADPNAHTFVRPIHANFCRCGVYGSQRERTATKLSLTILILTGGNVLMFGYLLVSGMERFSQAGPPAVVNFILTVLLFLFRRK